MRRGGGRLEDRVGRGRWRNEACVARMEENVARRVVRLWENVGNNLASRGGGDNAENEK